MCRVKMEETFCELLEKAIIDEKEAIEGYEKFKEAEDLSPLDRSLIFRGNILPIIKDEEKHLNILKDIKSEVCK